MESIKDILKKNGCFSIIESLLFAVLGIILVCKPEGTLNMIAWILGGIFIVTGLSKIISYFASKDNNDIFNFELIYGLTSIVIGIVFIGYINVISSIFRLIIGIWIIYTSFVRINLSLQIKKLENNLWIYSLILAMIMFGCGLYILINPGAIIVSIGTIMIVYAVIDIVENVIFMNNIKKLL